jgi:hypothetical protein
VKLPTELFTEFNTTITLVLVMNYTDLVSAGAGHICGYKTSSRNVNVGVNIHMIRPLYNHLQTGPSGWCSSDNSKQGFLLVKCFMKRTQMVIEG